MTNLRCFWNVWQWANRLTPQVTREDSSSECDSHLFTPTAPATADPVTTLRHRPKIWLCCSGLRAPSNRPSWKLWFMSIYMYIYKHTWYLYCTTNGNIMNLPFHKHGGNPRSRKEWENHRTKFGGHPEYHCRDFGYGYLVARPLSVARPMSSYGHNSKIMRFPHVQTG